MVIFINGKQKRVKRPPTIDGLSEEETLRCCGDPLLLHQLGRWEYMIPEQGPPPQACWYEFGDWEPSREIDIGIFEVQEAIGGRRNE